MKNVETNAEQKNGKKRNKKAFIGCAVALLVALIIGVVAALFFYQNSKATKQEEVSDVDTVMLSNSNYASFDAGFTDVVITDEETAIEAVGNVAASLGLTDVKKELKVKSVNTVDGSSYYRMQQYYNDIPVYGRNVVVCADKDGNATLLTANAINVGMSDVQWKDFDSKKAEKAVKTYFENTKGWNIENVSISEEVAAEQVIYNLLDGDSVFAAHVFTVSFLKEDKFKTYEVVFDSAEAKVLCATPDLYEVGVEAEVVSENGEVSTTAWLNNGEYSLYNDKYKISIFDFNGENPITDERREQDGGVLSDITKYGYSVVASEDNKFDLAGISALDNIIKCCDYYSVLGYSGFDSIHVAINQGGKASENASAGSEILEGKERALVLVGQKTGTADTDVLAHEYTHAVSAKVVAWAGVSPEIGAVCESVSDIFGELIECEALGWEQPDWCMQGDNIGVCRNLQDPASEQYTVCQYELEGKACPIYKKYDKHVYNKDYTVTKKSCTVAKTYPAKYRGEGYHVNNDSHHNSTVVSHAAYLMWNGIDGTENRKIDTNVLGKLWYRGLNLMQSNATFEQCADAVIKAAKQMYLEKILTEEQRDCVQLAFEEVGIASDIVEAGSTIVVYDVFDKVYADYHLTIEKMDFFGESSEVIVDEDIKSAEPYKLDVKEGFYVITVADNKTDGSNNTFSKSLTVIPSYRKNYKEISFITDFNRVQTDIYEQYKEIYLEKEKEYGQVSYNVTYIDDNDEVGYIGGLCFAKLMDFENDDVPELVIYHYKEERIETWESDFNEYYNDYKFEIFKQNSRTGIVEKVCEDIGISHGTGEGVQITVCEKNGIEYLDVSGAFETVYYGAVDGSIGKACAFEGPEVDDLNPTYKVDGQEVDEATYNQKRDAFLGDTGGESTISYYDMQPIYRDNQNELSNVVDVMPVINETRKTLGLEETSCAYVNNIKLLTAEEIHNALVAHYARGTEDGDDLTVWEGSFWGKIIYHAQVRCGVPGNPSASQMLYEIEVNAQTGEVKQTRVLTDDKVTYWNLFEEDETDSAATNETTETNQTQETQSAEKPETDTKLYGGYTLPNLIAILEEHYNEELDPIYDSRYVIFENDVFESENELTLYLRYQAGSIEIAEREAAGGTVSANVLGPSIIVELDTGKVYLYENKDNAWNLW